MKLWSIFYKILSRFSVPLPYPEECQRLQIVHQHVHGLDQDVGGADEDVEQRDEQHVHVEGEPVVTPESGSNFIF